MGENSRRERVRIEVLNTIEEREHFHQDIELIYILEGEMKIFAGDQLTILRTEDILVINANKKHSISASEDILFARLSIAYQLLSDIFQSVHIIFWCDSTRDDSSRFAELRQVLKRLLNHYLSTQGGVANFGHIALCYQVMDILSVNFLVQSGDRENMDEEEKFDARILQINNYVRVNYSQQISLKELADKLYLSYGYLARFFKKNYGMSFAEYLTNIRLFHAVDELLYTESPITRIAYDSGFVNAAVFNKAFKSAYGETPSSFRKKSSEQKHEEVQTGVQTVIGERLERYLEESGVEKEQAFQPGIISAAYDVRQSKPLKPIWNQLINGGSAEELLSSEVREHLVLLKENLDFQYVRFWNIFTEELLIDASRENENFNFSRLDSILDFLLQQGFKPHIELGLKPKRIQKTVQASLTNHNDKALWYSESQWKNVITAMMRHLIGRYGGREIAGWKLELWYDEHLSETADAIDSYLHLFDSIYEIVKGFCGDIQLGGCGIRSGYSGAFEAEILRRWKGQKYRPDFLSIIYYAYERGADNQETYSKRSTDNERFLHVVKKAKENIDAAGLKIPIYVTEWNLTISDRNYINDTCYKGAYVVKNMLDLYEQVEAAGYFVGSDRVSEHFDSNVLLYGGTGLLNKDGIFKPAGFAFEFLNRLYPYYIGNGDNYLISTDSQDTYGIICHNQKKLNYNYYFTKEDQIEKEHLWKYYEDRDELKLTLTMNQVANGIYQIKIYRVNEQNGSVMDIWRKMGYEKELSRNDIKYFRRMCESDLTIQKLEVMANTATVEIRLAENEIAFVKVGRLV